jgi:hypothetical protein
MNGDNMTKKQLIAKLEEMIQDREWFDTELKVSQSNLYGITDALVKLSECHTLDLKYVLKKVKEK